VWRSEFIIPEDIKEGEHNVSIETSEGTFDKPGRYLVICTTDLHFIFAEMYGWVTVK
jgi:plastocyanin